MTDKSTLNTYKVRVVSIQELAENIKEFKLAAIEASDLPALDPGAHISLRIPPHDGHHELWKSYSLISFDTSLAFHEQRQSSYTIAVLRDAEGQGGSVYLHDQTKVGDVLEILPTTNNFVLDTSHKNIRLLAGGIGITPLISMASRLLSENKSFELHYSCRSAKQFVYAQALNETLGNAFKLYADDDPARRFDLSKFIADMEPDQPIYTCGPAGLINAIETEALKNGWGKENLHSELFNGTKPDEGAKAFVVELKTSGKILEVPSDKSLLDVLLEEDLFVMYDCKQGHCGLCTIPVLSGKILHNDSYLTDEQKSSGEFIQSCVSRAQDRIVLDL